jgi:hypothetical protein
MVDYGDTRGWALRGLFVLVGSSTVSVFTSWAVKCWGRSMFRPGAITALGALSPAYMVRSLRRGTLAPPFPSSRIRMARDALTRISSTDLDRLLPYARAVVTQDRPCICLIAEALLRRHRLEYAEVVSLIRGRG